MPDDLPLVASRKEESPISIVNALSIAIVFGYMAAMPLWMWWPPSKVPPEILAIINQMMGAWGMAFGTVIQFHLGSSRSSKDAQKVNTETLSTLSNTAAVTAATAAALVPTQPVPPPPPPTPTPPAPGKTESVTVTHTENPAPVDPAAPPQAPAAEGEQRPPT